MPQWLRLFFTFVKINLLSTSGPASAGLLHAEAVGKFMTEDQFVEAIGFSSALPGSDALQLAMFVGYRYCGVMGALAACLAATLVPTVSMLGVLLILQRFQKEVWMAGFIKGLAPAVAVLLILTATKVLRGGAWQDAQVVVMLLASVLALVVFRFPSTLVLLGAGLIGALLYR